MGCLRVNVNGVWQEVCPAPAPNGFVLLSGDTMQGPLTVQDPKLPGPLGCSTAVHAARYRDATPHVATPAERDLVLCSPVPGDQVYVASSNQFMAYDVDGWYPNGGAIPSARLFLQNQTPLAASAGPIAVTGFAPTELKDFTFADPWLTFPYAGLYQITGWVQFNQTTAVPPAMKPQVSIRDPLGNSWWAHGSETHTTSVEADGTGGWLTVREVITVITRVPAGQQLAMGVIPDIPVNVIGFGEWTGWQAAWLGR